METLGVVQDVAPSGPSVVSNRPVWWVCFVLEGFVDETIRSLTIVDIKLRKPPDGLSYTSPIRKRIPAGEMP